VTKDVHPRSLLEEVCRLGLAEVDEKTDTVHLLRETYVPAATTRACSASSAPTSATTCRRPSPTCSPAAAPPRAGDLSPTASRANRIERLRPIVGEQWQALVRALVPDGAPASSRKTRPRRASRTSACASACTHTPNPPAANDVQDPAESSASRPARRRRSSE
jgi:hypothetical protein